MSALPVLQIGSTGHYVSMYQMNLNGLALNYNGFPSNGVYESKTSDATKEFQDRFDLPATGVVDPITWKLLLDHVKAIQKVLNARSYTVGYPDGWFGASTVSAVQRFQREHSLYPSGMVDPRTRQELFDPNHRDNYEQRPSSTSLSSLHPQVAALASRFLQATRAVGLDVRIVTAFRSWDEEDRLFAQGRWTPGQIITNARGGDSYHNWGLAFDAAPFENGVRSNDIQKYMQMGHIGEQVGLKWGGTFRSLIDYPHFQYTFGLNTWDLLNGVRPPA